MTRPRPSVLFLSPALLERRPESEPLRGVQLFDIALAGELAALGHPVTLPVEPGWRRRLAARHPHDRHAPRVRASLPLIKPLWTSIAALAPTLISPRRFDHLLVGNPSRGIGPAVDMVMRTKTAKHAAVLVHKGGKRASFSPYRRWKATAVAINQSLANAMSPWPAPLIVRYGVTNSHLFTPPPDRLDRLARRVTTDDPLNIVILGKLDEPWKGVRELVDAIGSLDAERRAHIHLHAAAFVSPPPRPTGFRATFHPWRPADQVPALLARMDVIAVPSLEARETFSQAIVQGMLTGLPVIASDVPALLEKLDTGAGLTWRLEHGIDELASHIKTLLDDPHARVRMSPIARETALERYVWDSDWFSRTCLSG